MKTIRPEELPAYLARITGIITREVEAAIKTLMEEVFARTVSRTRFSFQRWELEERRDSSSSTFVVRLPFHTHGADVPFTSNIWNNPYFADRLGPHASKIHQPLQEALNEIGLRPSPDLGEPIPPVPWPNPPNTVVKISPDDVLRVVEEAVQRALTKV